MLPVYEAIDVIKVISEDVGHTKPWVVLAKTPDGLKSFVTKLYTTEQVEQLHCVSKEVICNILAGEFELKVPDCALINIPDSLILKLTSENQQQFDNADPRPKFASLSLENVITATPTLNKKLFQNRIQMDTLFAFDNLIRNGDRGHPKVNLLIKGKEVYLIDHEFTFGIKDIENILVNTLQLEDRFTLYHLFYNYLKKDKPEKKRNFFNDFTFYLNSMNVNKLNPYFDILNKEGFSDYSPPIINWLNQIKENSTIFVNKLKGSLH